MQETQHNFTAGFKLPWLREIGLGLLLFCATVLAYLPALTGGLIIDDDSHVTAPAFQSLAGLRRIWTEPGATHQYYPFLHTAFWLEHRLWGDAVLGYHLVNVLQHAGSACLLVVILRRLFQAGANVSIPSGESISENMAKGQESRLYAGAEWLAGFIFALHPVCVESVAWISEQKNTLSTLLGLGAVLVYLRYDTGRRWLSYGCALGLFLLAVASKSMVVTLPCVLLVIFWWQRGRLEWKRDVLPLLPWLVLGIAATLPVMWLERKMWSSYAFAAEITLSFPERVLLAGRAFCFYLSKLLWPANLVFIYPRWTVATTIWWQYLFPLGMLGMVAVSWRMVRLTRGPLAALLIFTGTLFPVAGFFNVFWFAFSFVGDHLQYFPCLAIVTLAAAGAARLAERLPGAVRRMVPVLVVVLLSTLSLLTWQQCRLYRNAETLYRATLVKNPTCWIAHYNLGAALNAESGRQAEVIAEWETALRLRPDFAEGHGNLACIFAGDPARIPEAIKHFETALQFKPDFAEAHSNLASVLANDPTRVAEAIEHFKTALRLNPDSAETHNNYGNILIDFPDRLTEAVTQIETALRLQPDYAEAHWNLSVALARTPGRLPDAIAHLETALRLKPDLQGGQEMLQHLRSMQR